MTVLGQVIVVGRGRVTVRVRAKGKYLCFDSLNCQIEVARIRLR